MRNKRMAHPAPRGAHGRRVLVAAVIGSAAVLGVLGTASSRVPGTATTLESQAFQPVVVDSDVARRTLAPLRPQASALPASTEGDGPVIDLTLVPLGAAASPVAIPALTALAVPTERPSGPSHVVRQGESLWAIASMHAVPLDVVLRSNPEVDAESLRIGSTIAVPGGRPMSPVPAVTPTSEQRSTPKPARVTPRRERASTAAPSKRASAGMRHLWPLAPRGQVTTRFSSRHPGIDIAAPAGTPVRAIAAGVVRWAGWKSNGGGYVVVIRHPGGMTSTYNHNRRVRVSVGQRVVRGQRIADVGSTGLSTGPHLDVRIQMGGRFVNPLALF